jgi:hypothetical protein
MSTSEPPFFEEPPLDADLRSVIDGPAVYDPTPPFQTQNTRLPPNYPAAGTCAPSTTFRFIPAGELSVKPVCWLVDNYFEEDTLAVLYGPPGTGKSFLALDMACCIAAGAPFHGHEVKAGAVFYIAGEGHNGLARRIHAWSQHNNIPRENLSLYVSEGPIDLINVNNAIQVAAAVKKLVKATGKIPVLIVIDTLARNFGGDENSATEVGQFVRHLDLYLRKIWKTTTLIIHHSGKDRDRGARGSSALKGAVDAEYEVSRKDDLIIRITSRKMKDAEEPPPLSFELIGKSVLDNNGNPIGSAVLHLVDNKVPSEDPTTRNLGKQQKAALAILEGMHLEIAERLARQSREDHPVYVQIEDWKSKCEDANVSRQRFHDVKTSLVDRNQIRIEEPHVFLVRPPVVSLGGQNRTDAEKDDLNGSAPPRYKGKL